MRPPDWDCARYAYWDRGMQEFIDKDLYFYYNP